MIDPSSLLVTRLRSLPEATKDQLMDLLVHPDTSLSQTPFDDVLRKPFRDLTSKGSPNTLCDTILADAGIFAYQQQLLENARRTLDMIRRSSGVPTVPPENLDGLELLFDASVVADQKNRPPLRVVQGTFDGDLQGWLNRAAPDSQSMELYRCLVDNVKVRSLLPSVGRIEAYLAGRRTPRFAATSFVVAPNVLMTNSHVVKELAELKEGRWEFRSGLAVRADFRDDPQSVDEQWEFSITNVLGTHDEVDLALVGVDWSSAAAAPQPRVLTLASHFAGPLIDCPVCVIGFPGAFAPYLLPISQRYYLDTLQETKQVQPGLTREWNVLEQPGKRRHLFKHDATTRRGNSGSCVAVIATGEVIGLHCGGEYHDGLERLFRDDYNEAIKLWELQGDEFLSRAGVTFA